jgi:hypothetical protein
VTAQAIHNNYGDWYMNITSDAELNRLAIKGLKDYSSLNEVEKARFIETFMAFLSFSQNAFYQWRERHCLLGFGAAGSCSDEFARLTWRQRVSERTGLRFREGIPGLCGESHHDEEATSRSQAPRCFQDREQHLELTFLQTTGNQAKQS